MSTTAPIKNRDNLETFKNYYLEVKPNLRNYTLVILGLNTAFRISDLLKLQWKDVYDIKKKQFREHIVLKEQKTGKERVVAMNSTVLQILDYYYQIYKLPEPTSYLFPSAKNKSLPITRTQAYRLIKEAAIHTGLEEHISCHSLRKTFGYHAWKQGVPPAMLMNIYNHSSYKITKRYLCIEQDERDDVYRNIHL
ncbi:MAG: tyrosine-type recombinase/integrase [Lachnospiraceae bacterium]|nr:tyrosine-type recombinase/integrase [Lachnospiraceae bacterium]